MHTQCYGLLNIMCGRVWESVGLYSDLVSGERSGIKWDSVVMCGDPNPSLGGESTLEIFGGKCTCLFQNGLRKSQKRLTVTPKAWYNTCILNNERKMMKEWNEMSMEERTEMVAEIWAHVDDRIPLNTPRAQLTNAEHIAKFRNARAIEKIRNAKPLPVSPRKEAKLRSAITKLKMESV